MASTRRETPGPRKLPPPRTALPETLFLVEQVMPNMTAADLTAIQHTLAEAAHRTTAAGRPVRYVRAVYVPSQSRLVGLFEAADADAVRAAVRLAQLPFVPIEPVIDLPMMGEGTDALAPAAAPHPSGGTV